MRTGLSVLRWPIVAALMMVGLAALYRFAADREDPEWAWVSPGAVGATATWLVGSVLFSAETVSASMQQSPRSRGGAPGQAARACLLTPSGERGLSSSRRSTNGSGRTPQGRDTTLRAASRRFAA